MFVFSYLYLKKKIKNIKVLINKISSIHGAKLLILSHTRPKKNVIVICIYFNNIKIMPIYLQYSLI